jgi:undecaprenyl-diphosphatase
VTQGAKALADRPRPGALLGGVHVRTLGASGNGYPSGHAAVAAAIVAALVPWVGHRTRTALWLIAASVAFARIFFGVHLPLDVVGGAGIGLIFGTIATVLIGIPERTGAR